MTDTQAQQILQKEIEELKTVLDEKYPNWFDDTIRDFTDYQDEIRAAVCIPIRAAIKLLRRDNR